MNIVFKIVEGTLSWFSDLIGLSYKEVNIILYFIIIPFIFIHLINKILDTRILKIGFAIGVLFFFIIVTDFQKFSIWLFDRSFDFLNSFDNIGLDYTQASVIICVILPGIIFLILFYFAYKTKINYFLKRNNNSNILS